MADLTIADAPLADVATLTDRIPVSQGDGLPKTITLAHILALMPADNDVPGLPVGGTAGQVLQKASADDFDAAWVTPQSGSIGLRAGLLPSAAELVGSVTEPVLAGVSGSNTNWSELRYNDSVVNTAIWVVPSSLTTQYGGADLTVRIRWKSAAIFGDVLWAVALGGFADGEVVDTSLQAYRAFPADTAKGTAEQINEATITFSCSAAELTAGDILFLAVRRLSTDGQDTMVGDAKLLEILLYES